MASWSQLDAGNWRTAKVMVCGWWVVGCGWLDVGCSPSRPTRNPLPTTNNHLFHFQFVVFYYRIAEEFVTCFIELAAGGFRVGAVQFDFQVFADVDRVDAAVAH